MPSDERVPRHPQRPAEEPVAPPLRELVGRVLRAARQDAGERLVDVAARAGVSPQYLSEVERGRKDPSSEIVAVVADAVGLDLDGLLVAVARLRGLDVGAPAPAPQPLPLRVVAPPPHAPRTRPDAPTCLAA